MSDLNRDNVVKQAIVFTGDQVRDAWVKSKLSHLEFISTNKSYRALPKSVWNQILAEHLSIHKYVPEFFDCDSFAAALMGMVAYDFEINGICRVLDISGHHSYNAVLVCDDGKTCSWLRVEPQADLFLEDIAKRGQLTAGVSVTSPDGAYAATSGFAVTA